MQLEAFRGVTASKINILSRNTYRIALPIMFSYLVQFMEGSVRFTRKSSGELFSFQLLLDPVVLRPGGGHHLAAPHPRHSPLASRYIVLLKDRKKNSKEDSRIAR